MNKKVSCPLSYHISNLFKNAKKKIYLKFLKKIKILSKSMSYYFLVNLVLLFFQKNFKQLIFDI